jgi:protein-tyrosine phosphatase
MISFIKASIPNLVKRNIKGLVRNVVDSLQYYTISGTRFFCSSSLREKTISSVIFVCKGNVCRSAFAEHRLEYLTDNDLLHIDSCGLDVDQGNFPPPDSVAVAAEFSCSLADRRAKGLQECDVAGADLILAMEYWQYTRLVQLYPEKKDQIHLLRSLAPFPYCLFCNIADPYGWGKKEFRRIYRLIDRILHNLKHWC